MSCNNQQKVKRMLFILMKVMNCKMYFSQALGELPSDPNYLMKGQPTDHGECCQ